MKALLPFFCFLLMAVTGQAQTATKATPVPAAPAEGYYLGHRYYEDKSGGWGWLKKPNESWQAAEWITLKETIGGPVAPHRSLPTRQSDHDHEYKIWGRYAGYTAYDPHRDEWLKVFIIERYEDLGQKAPVPRKPGPNGRPLKQRKSGASSKITHPISTGPDADSF